MTNPLKIRKALVSDVAVLASILSEAARYKVTQHNDLAWQTPEGSTIYSEAEARKYIDRDDTYLIEVADEAAGTFALQWDDEFTWGKRPPDAGYLHRLAIRDTYRGSGLGTEAINWATKEVYKKGRAYLRLDCPPSNRRLRAYYEKQGFTFKEVKPVYQGQKNPRIAYKAALYELPV